MGSSLNEVCDDGSPASLGPPPTGSGARFVVFAPILHAASLRANAAFGKMVGWTAEDSLLPCLWSVAVERTKDVARWLTEALAGSHEALGHALEGCRGYLLHVAMQELDADLASKAGASDLVQETFLEAQRDFARFQGKG